MVSKNYKTSFDYPTSSASSEKCWRAYFFNHNKKRNRLKPTTQEKLVFVYINGVILDNKDDIDHCDNEELANLKNDEEAQDEIELILWFFYSINIELVR